MFRDDNNSCPLEYISCHTDSKSLRVSWRDHVPEKAINPCIELITALVKALSVQNLVINGSCLKDPDSGLNWKIIESCWLAFCENGGKKIVVINKSRPPHYLEEEYTNAIKEYGIPIELEFRGEGEDNFEKGGED
jgi:hypothetical protein